MEVIALALSLAAFFFSLGAFATGAYACITVIGWSRSTHKIEYRPPEETVFTRDLPPGVEEHLPSAPEAISASEYAKRLEREMQFDPYNE